MHLKSQVKRAQRVGQGEGAEPWPSVSSAVMLLATMWHKIFAGTNFCGVCDFFSNLQKYM